MADAGQTQGKMPQRLGTMAALLASSFAFGLGFGGFAPLVALTLESRGIDAVIIGANSSMSPIGVILASALTPSLVRKFGTITVFYMGVGLSFLAMLAMPLVDNLAVWFGLRLLIGMGIAGPWVISETWINQASTVATRARIMAIYTSVLAAGFAVGPLLLATVGIGTTIGFVLCAILFGTGALPIWWVRHHAPALDQAHKTPMLGILARAPTILGAAFVAGLMDAAIFSFLPIYGLRIGLAEQSAIALLSLFLIGNLLFQLPIGWLADKLNRRTVLAVCAGISAVGPIVVALVADNLLMAALPLLIWGGTAWSLYSIALAMLGDRFQGTALATGNAAFVIAFEIANVIGPPMAGGALELWPPHGLIAFMSAAGGVYFVIVVARGLVRRRR